MSERIVAVVPIRSLRNGKTRLAPVLGVDDREALLQRVAAGVIDAAIHAGSIDTILVVSPDAETLAWAAALGPPVVPLPQPESLPGLNGAIDAGRTWALAAGAAAMLSLFADLPLLAPENLRAFARRAEPVVLGADRREEGTNAFLLRLGGQDRNFASHLGRTASPTTAPKRAASVSTSPSIMPQASASTSIPRRTGTTINCSRPSPWPPAKSPRRCVGRAWRERRR